MCHSFLAATHPLRAEWPPQGCHRPHPARGVLAACPFLLSSQQASPSLPRPKKEGGCQQEADSLRALVPLSLLWTPFSHPTTVRAWRAVP